MCTAATTDVINTASTAGAKRHCNGVSGRAWSVPCQRSRPHGRARCVSARAFFGRGEKTTASGKGGPASSSQLVPFPKDYDQLVSQAQRALQAALDDGVPLMEMQFPPAGLDTVPGDVEGNAENNCTVQHLRGICAQFERNKTAATTRVFFPDPIERSLALTGASAGTTDGVRAPENAETEAMFADWKGTTDYLESPDFLSVSGLDKLLNKRVTLDKRTKKTDTAFVVAYPSLNTSELTRTKELYDGEVKNNTGRPVLVCNGELERTRSNYYPAFWNVAEMTPLRDFARAFEGVYYIHNFKGSNPAVLFRAYPGPWQVLRRRRATGELELVHTMEEYPGIQKVALEILPKYP